MRWFQGGIAEAVNASKVKNSVFVVFVEGTDDISKNTSATIDSPDIASKLESNNFVAIKLTSETEAYRQFAQIYQIVPVPSIFFIGSNGTPLEVVAGAVTVSELLPRIDTVLEKHGIKVVNSSPGPSDNQLLTTESEPVATTLNSPSEDLLASERATNEPTPSSLVPSSEAVDEGKIEKAKELLEMKRKQKLEEDKEAEKAREVERRKVGQEVQKLRRWQQDQEMKQLREDRQREKAEETAARERILKQIEQDKAERAARFAKDQPPAPKPTEAAKSGESRPTSAQSGTTRIQFRLPDGVAHTQSFAENATLGELRTFASTQLNMPSRQFGMSTTFPRRTLTPQEDHMTLTELELVPTAVILILPAASNSVVSSSSEVPFLSRMFWTLIAPLVSIYAFLRGLVFGANPNPNPRRAPESRKRQNSDDPQGSGAVRRQGNVHRLGTNRDSSDDENNTWNGNSTQQM